MAQVTLNPTADVHITQSIPTSNQNGVGFIDVGEYNGATGDTRRALIKFDLSSIPAGSIITSATFRIYNTGTDLTDNARTMYANRMKRAWTETGATWNKYDGTNDWATAGGGTNSLDVDFTAFGNVAVTNPPTSGWHEISLTASMVQDWFDGTFTNNGLMLSMGTELNDLQRFHSRNEANPEQLVLVYRVPIHTNIIKLQAVNRASTY